MKKEYTGYKIYLAILLILLAISISIASYRYLAFNYSRGRPELVYEAVELDIQNNAINVIILNVGSAVGTISDITQIELTNTTITQNPIDVTDNNQLSLAFPIKIKYARD